MNSNIAVKAARGPHICKGVSHYYKNKIIQKRRLTPVKLKSFMPCRDNTFLQHVQYVCVCVCETERERQRETGTFILWSRFVLAHTPGICFGWLVVNAHNMLCSAGNLFKDTVESFFVKVYNKGRPKGVCHNEVVFKTFTKYRGDSGRGKSAHQRLVLSPTENE